MRAGKIPFCYEYNYDRATTKPTEVGEGDVFAVVGEDKVRILAGSRVAAGQWGVNVHGLSSIGLPADANIQVNAWEFVGTESHFDEGQRPKKLQTLEVQIQDDMVHLLIDQKDARSAFAFEFSRS